MERAACSNSSVRSAYIAQAACNSRELASVPILRRQVFFSDGMEEGDPVAGMLPFPVMSSVQITDIFMDILPFK